MVETKPLFMFLVLPLTFLGLAVNGEKVVHTSWDSTSEWDFQKSSYSKISSAKGYDGMEDMHKNQDSILLVIAT